jgi:hypothetical protein
MHIGSWTPMVSEQYTHEPMDISCGQWQSVVCNWPLHVDESQSGLGTVILIYSENSPTAQTTLYVVQSIVEFSEQ